MSNVKAIDPKNDAPAAVPDMKATAKSAAPAAKPEPKVEAVPEVKPEPKVEAVPIRALSASTRAEMATGAARLKR